MSDSDKRTDSRRRGILLVGHGTRDQTGTDQFFQLGRAMDKLTDHWVQPCLLEFQSPTIDQGWRLLMDKGVDHVHVAPLLLFAAGHAKSDIPDEVQKAATGTPINWDQCRPLSRSPEIVELVCKRIEQVAAARSLVPDQTAVLMVGRGSHDPCARSDMRVLTEVVRRRQPAFAFETAFYAMTTPKVPETLDAIAESGRYKTILVQPHLLFQGRLYDAIDQQCRQADERHANVRVLCGDYLGPCDAVAAAVLRRINQTGFLRSNSSNPSTVHRPTVSGVNPVVRPTAGPCDLPVRVKPTTATLSPRRTHPPVLDPVANPKKFAVHRR